MKSRLYRSLFENRPWALNNIDCYRIFISKRTKISSSLGILAFLSRFGFLRILTWLIIVSVQIGIICGTARAEDIVWLENGTGSALQNTTEYGTILSSTPEGLIFKDSKGEKQWAVRHIAAVQYEEEPVELILARIQYRASDNEGALAALNAISPEILLKCPPKICEERDYLFCMAAMRLLLAEWNKTDSDKKQENGKSIPLELDEKTDRAIAFASVFFNKYPHSWHLYEVARTVKDLCCRRNKYEEAIRYCDYLSKASWPELKLEGMFYKGLFLFKMNKLSEAETVFQQICEEKGAVSSGADRQKILIFRIQAGLNLAEIAFSSGRYEEAVQQYQALTEKYQKETLPEHDDFLQWGAQMYNGLGLALVKSGNRKEAIHAFLHVDLLYSEVKEERRKALQQLEVLWREEGYPARAQEIRTRLEQ